MRFEIQDAKKQLSRLVERAAAGEEIVLSIAGAPVARMIAYDPPKREPGCLKGKIWISPDFDEPDAEIEKLFYGE
jgi:prevent-host-death family protein